MLFYTFSFLIQYIYQMGKGKLDCSCEGEISLGPWGYNDTGNEWSYRTKQGGIKQIIIRCGGIIDSLMFKADSDGDGDGDYSSKFGGDGGDRTIKIDIDFPSEYLTGISGTYGSFWMFGHNVCSLNFHTNRNRYGPFGSGNGTAFSVNANGGVITGFHGRYGRFLESIGVYITPLCSFSTDVKKNKFPEIASGRSLQLPFLPPPRSAAAVGGSGGREWDDGVFAAVKGVHVRVRVDTGVLSAVRFSYLKNDGSDFLSPFHGGSCSGDTHRKTILFAEKEYLIGVEGYHGLVDGMSDLNVIKSLSFITSKAKYGPIGAEMGTYFTTMNSGDCNRKVVGFHGRSGAYLDAIGLHTECEQFDGHVALFLPFGFLCSYLLQ